MMNAHNINLPENNIFDFVIIGGGPTGSTAAIYLRRYGYSVLVLERSLFPRQHEGESLLPFCGPLFRDMGIIDTLNQHFVRKPGVQFATHDAEKISTWWFRNIIPGEDELSYHVLRAKFDEILLNKAAENGAEVQQQSKAEQVTFLPDEGLIVVDTVHPNRGAEQWQAKFLIDASGQDTFLARKFGTKQAVEHLDRIAFLAHWEDAQYLYKLDEGFINIIYLEGAKKGWMAIQPVGKNRLSVALIIDRKYLKQQKQVFFKQDPDNWQELLYRAEIESTPFAHNILKSARIVQQLVMVSDYSYVTGQKFGAQFALLGDAFKFLDPIFASGVYLGMNSAKLFVEGMHKKITTGSDGELNAVFNMIDGAYRLVEKFINIFYNPDLLNLAKVDAASSHADHELAFSLVHYLMAGDFFDDHHRYDSFLDILANPIQFKRWRNLSNSRPLNNSITYTYEQIFGSIIDEEAQ